MPAIFTLDVATELSARRAVLRFGQAGGLFIAAHEVDLTRHAAASWHGLFDTRRHIRSLEGVTAPAVRLEGEPRQERGGDGVGRALAGVEAKPSPQQPPRRTPSGEGDHATDDKSEVRE
ncbi:MAG: hypothetical protein ABI134_34530 [Byssovorax sp.]